MIKGNTKPGDRLKILSGKGKYDGYDLIVEVVKDEGAIGQTVRTPDHPLPSQRFLCGWSTLEPA